MSGFFSVASKSDCVSDIFSGTDDHSHLGTRRGGMVTVGPSGFSPWPRSFVPREQRVQDMVARMKLIPRSAI